MKRAIKYLSILLSVVLAVIFIMPKAFAAAPTGIITGDGVRLRNKATTVNSTVITTLSKGSVVIINGVTEGNEAISGSGTKWYSVTYGDYRGYIYGKYVSEVIESSFDPDFETNLLNFPEDYRDALRAIHITYPNWIFIADNVNVSLDEAVDYQYGKDILKNTDKWVELNFGVEWRDERVDVNNSAHILESRWTYASHQAIAYYMDIRNALTVSSIKSYFPNIFTFLEQSYNSLTQTEDGLRSVVAGTFLENGYGGNEDAYINDIMYAAKESDISPYVIAGTIIIEQGSKGNGDLISGNYQGYEGYFNFFNYGAYGDNLIKNGLEFAKNSGWNSRRASILGGATLYQEGYISRGQDTYYYMDFNVKAKGTHQYATSLYDQCIKAYSMRRVCILNTNAALTFKIPVYSSVPASPYAAPSLDTYKHIPGDINGDRILNNKDLSRLFQYLSSWEVNVNYPALDINNDGAVNNKDLSRLFQYLSEWEVTIF